MTWQMDDKLRNELEGQLVEAVAARTSGAMVVALFDPTRLEIIASSEADKALVFDLASLTKPLATAAVTIQAVDRGWLTLDEDLTDSDRTLAGRGFKGLTPLHLLTHSGGFAPFMHPTRATLLDASEMERQHWFNSLLDTTKAMAPVGAKTIYSDIGYLYLQRLLRQRSGKLLDQLYNEMLGKADLEACRVRYRDLQQPWSGPTPACSGWVEDRARMLCGEVHDPVAWMLNGVAAHAGLFGDAWQVATLMQSWLHQARGEEVFFAPTHNDIVFKSVSSMGDGSRTAGWDTPTGEQTQAGAGHPSDTIGHLAFTGCAVWWSPTRQMGAVLLANRTKTDGDLESFRRIRREVYGKIWQILTGH